jgi:hypothetical protein
VANNRLVLDLSSAAAVAGAIPQVREYLRAGQVFSSTAAADPQQRLAVGYIDNGLLNATTWGDLAVDASAVLTKLTYLGDANLDGRVNADDFALIDRGFATGGQVWWLGDFNYDHAVTSADYLLIDRVFAQQGGTLSPEFFAMREAEFGPAYTAALVTSVPEPVTLVATAPLLLLYRRGRRPRRQSLV